jgi:hypothetical protein
MEATMRKLICILLIAAPLALAAVVIAGPFWMITISRIDIEGYPVYTVWKNLMPYATASSRKQAESYTRTPEENRRRIQAIYDRGWEIARIRHDVLMDGTVDETWRVWYRDGTTAKDEYFKSEAAAKAFVEARKQ